MTHEVLLGYVGKRVRVTWDSAATFGKDGGSDKDAQTARLEEVGGIAWFAGGRSLPLSWITSIEAVADTRALHAALTKGQTSE